MFVRFSILLILCSLAFAQDIVAPIPAEKLIAPEDKQSLNAQAIEIFKEWDKLAAPIGRSVVALVSGKKQVALGTVIGQGKVLTKLSELKQERRPVMLVDAEGKIYDAKVLFALPEHDLILLDAPSLKLPPIDMESYVDVSVGQMIAAVSPSGHVSDFGVVSVAQRSLRSEDQSYLGIVSQSKWTGEGVLVAGVEPQSGAQQCGLQRGDIIVSINNKSVDGLYSIRSAMAGVRPGTSIPYEVLRNGQLIKGTLVTSARPKAKKFPQKRLEQMNAMGNRMSLKRGEFPLVLQSDLTLYPERAGCPVIDIHGRFVGIALSRAGRTETYILPSWICRELVQGVLPKVEEYHARQQGNFIPDAIPVDELYDASRLEENKRRVEERMRRQGLIPKVY